VAGFRTLQPLDLLENPRNGNGMVIAQRTAIAFVPTKFGAWLTKGGRKNALDDFCYSLGPVVTRRGK
jgi:hypothetical protein